MNDLVSGNEGDICTCTSHYNLSLSQRVNNDSIFSNKLVILSRNATTFIKDHYTPRKQSLGGYIGITLSIRPSVHPSMYLVSATPPKPLIGFL
jgi:hypothetical protein